MRFVRSVAVTLAALLLATTLVVLSPADPAGAAPRRTVMTTAAAYGKSQGYDVGIAVLDTKTGHLYGSGNYRGIFASESVVKVFIAARLIIQGKMHGHTASLAYKMITQSDDSIASYFYGQVGGDGLINWVKSYFDVPSLGYPPTRAGWWGNTHIRPSGLVRLYAKLKANKRIAPWLLHAMHHAKEYGSDGTYQFFGIPSATKGAAIKQGWGNDAGYGSSADFNTTGFVNQDRYAVAILAQGPISSYGSKIGNLLTNVAKRLLPGGQFPAPAPVVTRITKTTGPSGGGTTLVVHGTDLSQLQGVFFGAVKAAKVHRLSANRLQVVSPRHQAGMINVRVVTDHGKSSPSQAEHFTFVAGPQITAVKPSSGPVAGGTVVTISGTGLGQATRVRFGLVAGTAVKVLSPTSVRVTAPAHKAGRIDITVTTPFGTSPFRVADRYTYQATPPPAP